MRSSSNRIRTLGYILLLSASIRARASNIGKKFLMTQAAKSKGAVCLDGTPGAYFFSEGSGSGATKWYIHHQGGGWCESLDDCVGRSKTGLGSSSSYPDTMDFGGGYFSRDPTENPLMHNWNMVHMNYCDGASFSGYNENVSVHNGVTLHWRGALIREAFQSDLLENRGLASATDLVVSGCSAGGLATYLHTNQWCDALNERNSDAKCVGLPDSGFFLDYQDPTVACTPDSGLLGATINGDYHCGLKWTFLTQNATRGVNQDCIEAHRQADGDDSLVWKCMFAEHSSEHIRYPVFALQSQYDSWQTGNVQGNGGDPKTQEMGNNITSRLQTMLLARNNESGAFLDSCHHHCGAWNSIRIDGDLVSAAMEKWYAGIGTPGSKKLWNQDKPYPCDACCKPN